MYVQGRTIHIRRVRDGADRLLLTLPQGAGQFDVLLAAGSSGVAVAIENSSSTRTRLYRLPWRLVDRTLAVC